MRGIKECEAFDLGGGGGGGTCFASEPLGKTGPWGAKSKETGICLVGSVVDADVGTINPSQMVIS